jgi:hypothetical protein
MKTSRIASLCLLLLGSSVARAQGTSVTNQPMGAGAGPQPGSASEEVRPPTAAPGQAPPMPPQQPPPAPGPSQGRAPQQIEQTSSPAQAAGAGQWVYTSEYGWIWMPYGDQYTHEGMANDDSPYSYAYYPSYGWMWLAAPWVWGWGAYPYFGSLGPSGFGWYRGLYRAGYGWGGYRGGGRGGYGMGGGNRGNGGGFRWARNYGAVGGYRGGAVGGNRAVGGFRGSVGGGPRGGFGGHSSFGGGHGSFGGGHGGGHR